MLVLWEQESVLVKQLGAALHVGYGTLTRVLKRLEAHGVLRRERRADDERSVLITLTEQGTAPRDRAEAVPGLMAKGTGLEPAEFAQLRAALRQLTSNVTKAPHPNAASPPAELADQSARPCLTAGSSGTEPPRRLAP